MEPARIDWGSASVQDGTLTVPLTGDRPKGWKPSFERTVALLSAGAGKGNWDEVVLKAGKVKVTGLQAGAEDRLRTFLEGAVQQADAEHRPDDADKDDSDSDSDSEAQANDQAAEDPDAELTARFQAFAD